MIKNPTIKHANPVAAQWPTAKGNVVESRKVASAKNIAVALVQQFARGSLAAHHRQLSHH